MDAIRIFSIISWVSLPTVMFGGYSFLRLQLKDNRLTPFQATFFRAGHAHAGVLLVLSLVYQQYLRQTNTSEGWAWVLCGAVMAGILGVSGGFFLQVIPGKTKPGRLGMLVTTGGAILLALAILALALQLLIA